MDPYTFSEGMIHRDDELSKVGERWSHLGAECLDVLHTCGAEMH